MGFFSSLFGKQQKEETPVAATPSQAAVCTLKSPLTGELVSSTETEDPTFAEQILGPTVAFKLTKDDDCTIYAPCDGIVTQIFKTAHAVTLSSKDMNVEMLIHIGIDTVNLKGEGFTALVQDDQEVKAGDPLIKFDPEFLESKGYKLIVPMAICNAADFESVTFVDPKKVAKGDDICTVQAK